MVSSKVVSKKTEFIRHISALNGSFFEWFQEQYDKDPHADLRDGVQDYIDYVHQLQDRYLKEYGEVLTFGSGGNLPYMLSALHASPLNVCSVRLWAIGAWCGQR